MGRINNNCLVPQHEPIQEILFDIDEWLGSILVTHDSIPMNHLPNNPLHHLQCLTVLSLVSIEGTWLLRNRNKVTMTQKLHIHLDGCSLIHGNKRTYGVVAIQEIG